MANKEVAKISMALDSEGLMVEKGQSPAQAFYLILMQIFAGYGRAMGGFDGKNNRLLIEIKHKMENAIKVQEAFFIAEGDEIVFLKAAVEGGRTAFEIAEARARVDALILDCIKSSEGKKTNEA